MLIKNGTRLDRPPQRAYDITNERFGKLVAKYPIRDSGGQLHWHCACDCGNECDVRTHNLIYGIATSCGCHRTENLRRIHSRPRETLAVNAIYRNYRQQAIARGIQFDLSTEVFRDLINESCHYCGCPPTNAFTSYPRIQHEPYFYNGIDRVDNNKGYDDSNCVPCCAQCNWAKRDLTSKQFKAWIHSVHTHLFGGAYAKSTASIIDELATANWKCFMAQEDMHDANDCGNRDEVARYALLAQSLNARRNQLIRAIDERLGELDISPTEKTYG